MESDGELNGKTDFEGRDCV